MRYLVAADTWFPEQPEGMARVAWDHAVLMAERGHEVVLVHLGQGSGDFEGVRVVGLGLIGGSGGERVVWSYLSGRLARLVAARLERGPWEAVHLSSPMLGSAVLRVLEAPSRVVYTLPSPVAPEQRIMWAMRGPLNAVARGPQLAVLNHIEGRLLRRCDAAQALSRYCADLVSRLHRVDPVIIPHWVSIPPVAALDRPGARSRLGWDQKERVLLSVRAHKPRVGLEDLIAAAAPAVRDGLCRVIIGGTGPLTQQLRALARELDVQEGVGFCGRLTEEQLQDAYAAADLFVLPTRHLECLGLVTLEAMARGCPVLGSDAGATPEVLGPVAPAFLFPAGDVEALRSKIEAFLSGDLEPPAPEVLRGHVADRYGRDRIGRLIEGFVRGAPEADRRPSS